MSQLLLVAIYLWAPSPSLASSDSNSHEYTFEQSLGVLKGAKEAYLEIGKRLVPTLEQLHREGAIYPISDIKSYAKRLGEEIYVKSSWRTASKLERAKSVAELLTRLSLVRPNLLAVHDTSYYQLRSSATWAAIAAEFATNSEWSDLAGREELIRDLEDALFTTQYLLDRKRPDFPIDGFRGRFQRACELQKVEEFLQNHPGELEGYARASAELAEDSHFHYYLAERILGKIKSTSDMTSRAFINTRYLRSTARRLNDLAYRSLECRQGGFFAYTALYSGETWKMFEPQPGPSIGTEYIIAPIATVGAGIVGFFVDLWRILPFDEGSKTILLTPAAEFRHLRVPAEPIDGF